MNLLTSSRFSRAKRSAPRIISRSYDKLRRIDEAGTSSSYYVSLPTQPIVPTDVEQEVQSEIYMKGGVAVSISSAAAKLNEHCASMFASPSHAHNAESDGTSAKSDSDGFIELPGVANEVESYPCPICDSDKVFLTANGLERHTRSEHLDNIAEVQTHIVRIQNEWKRRRILGVPANPTDNDNTQGDLEASRNPIILMPVSQNKLSEICRRCGFSAATSGAMEYHIEAHKKNDELRKHLIEEYGEKFVEFVTCKQCSLVFADGRALFEHIRANHKRKNTGYICRWCGKIFVSMSQLNAHKLDVHNIPVHNTSQYRSILSGNGVDMMAQCNMNEQLPPTMESLSDSNSQDVSVDVDSYDEPGGSGTDLAALESYSYTHRDDIHQANARIVESLNNDAKIDETAPCKAKCEICGLVMIKPSLLVRHMLRVHNKNEFVADVTSRHTVPLKFSIFADGNVVWRCCDIDFTSRDDILMHRRLMHGRAAINAHSNEPSTSKTSSHDVLQFENVVNVGVEDNSDKTNLQHDGVPITCEEIFLESDSAAAICAQYDDGNPDVLEMPPEVLQPDIQSNAEFDREESNCLLKCTNIIVSNCSSDLIPN